MTTVEPGASEVFTQGFLFRPSAAAFLARMPAPSMTYGFEVLVHEVIAATVTAPCFRLNFLPSYSTGTPSISGSAAMVAACTFPPSPSQSVPSVTTFAPAALGLSNVVDRSLIHCVFISLSAIWSCGRFGPERAGTTVDMSSSSVAEYLMLRESSRHRPCSLQYCSTVAMSFSSLPVRCMYFVVCSSIGKKPMVAPYSGAMFAIVARFASGMSARPGP